ncbi:MULTISPECIES: hypothetical protein [unclassified Streptomyces]|uniref:hypothetical protein n=1 Tax=unclassified Streptomyces TaxID=2593676 RepID=UPI0033D908DC
MGGEAPEVEPGLIELFVPPDWFDLLADGADEEATRVRCAEIIRLTYPETPAHRREEFVNGLMKCHERYLADGALMYGVITAPLPHTGAQAVWQVQAGVVAVPSAPDEVDLGELMSRVFDVHFKDEVAYAERFATEMGFGIGFLSQPPVPVVENLRGDLPADLRTGLAGALTCPPEGGRGLLVVGTCLDPDQVRELAGLVAIIAGNSVFPPAPSPNPSDQ